MLERRPNVPSVPTFASLQNLNAHVFACVFMVTLIIKRPQQQHTLPRGTFGPHFRVTSSSGAFPPRPPSGFPQGFHVFMEMAPGSVLSATGDQANQAEQPSMYFSSAGGAELSDYSTVTGFNIMERAYYLKFHVGP